MSTIDELKARKSVRVFEERTISEEIKEQLYTAAFEAPTAGNQMLYSIIEITDPQLLAQLAETCDHQQWITKAQLAVVFVADHRRWLDLYAAAGCAARRPGVGDMWLALSDANIAVNYDFNALLAAHQASGADVTVAYQKTEIPEGRKNDNYTLTIDSDGRVTELLFNDYRSGVQNLDLNIYVLERETLIKLVKDATARGLIYFERDILAHNVNILNIHALEYTGYVAHICDMKSYFDENLKLIDDRNLEALFPKGSPIYTKIRDDNPTRYVTGSKVVDSILADGCVIEGTVENCVLFRGVKVKKGAVVKNCVLMQDTVVEPNVELDCVVTDKNVKITAGKKLSGTESFPVYVQKNHTV